MEAKKQGKLSKKGLRNAQKQFREWCRKPIAKEVLDLIRETFKYAEPVDKKKNERSAKGTNLLKEVDV